jgi:cation diffusion facilitator family transporter
MTATERLALGSIGVGIIVLALKFQAYALSGSVALYSDAVESIVNVVAAVAAFIAVRMASQPADADHPYGHHKAEYLSAVIEGALIVLAAMAILREAWDGFQAARVADFGAIGLMVNALAGGLNAAWCGVLMRQGKRLKSPALLADATHLRADVVSSTGVLVGIILAVLTGWWWLDPLLATLVAVNILWSGWHLIGQSMSSLMDRALPPDELAAMQALISQGAQGALQAHDIRTRRAGQRTFIDFHLVVPGTMSVATAHEVCDRIEAAIRTQHDDVVITIHVEPEHKAKQKGAVVIDR